MKQIVFKHSAFGVIEKNGEPFAVSCVLIYDDQTSSSNVQKIGSEGVDAAKLSAYRNAAGDQGAQIPQELLR